jgi:hypothetical protein
MDVIRQYDSFSRARTVRRLWVVQGRLGMGHGPGKMRNGSRRGKPARWRFRQTPGPYRSLVRQPPKQREQRAYFRPSFLPGASSAVDSRMRRSRVSGRFAMWIQTTKLRRSVRGSF